MWRVSVCLRIVYMHPLGGQGVKFDPPMVLGYYAWVGVHRLLATDECGVCLAPCVCALG